MLRLNEIRLAITHTDEDLRSAILQTLGIEEGELLDYRIHKKSIDARKRRQIRFAYSMDISVVDEASLLQRHGQSGKVCRTPELSYQWAGRAPDNLTFRPVVVGAGPSGLFATLVLARMGFRPLLIERGRRVRERARDVAGFWKTGVLNPESNALFGEGGAGTFSDGKLVTQIKDRKNRCRLVLEELVAAGAPEEILYLNKPHIGTDRLIGVIRNLRNRILYLGGEVRFECRVVDLRIEKSAIRGVVLDTGESVESMVVVFAIGHSARDTFEMLLDKGIALEPKPFSIGLRIEHPQEMIDSVQYGDFAGNPELGAADYRLAQRCSNGRSVYTFCMCPGGTVIAAASEAGCVVTNGMSSHARNRVNANSALLVGIAPTDFSGEGPLAGLAFQRYWEKRAYDLGGGGYRAPAQLVGDFLAARVSRTLGDIEPSYQPGVSLSDLAQSLPEYAVDALREALPIFERKIKGFSRPDAVLTGVETRSSSPVRIIRNSSMESVSAEGLFPAGEGAGYAGGIISAAVDGIKAAEAIALKYSGAWDNSMNNPG
ncbi:MAG: hypothetical protein P8Z37_02305 [Acidobacteriota bacterium]